MRTKNLPKKKLLTLIMALAFFSLAYVAKACNASFTYTLGSGGQVTFNSTSTGTSGSTSYEWAPGTNGVYSWGTNSYSYTYAYNGTYVASLSIMDSNSGCYSSAYDTIVITNAATCNLSVSFSSVAGANGQYTFTSTSTGVPAGAMYSWDPGDGSGAVQGSSVFTYNYLTNNSYNVTLTIQDSTGGCSGSMYTGITVTNAPDSVAQSDTCVLSSFMDSVMVSYYDSISGNFDSAIVYFYSTSDTTCDSNSHRMSHGKVTPVMYAWDFGDGHTLTSAGKTSVNHTYTTSGNYTASLSLSRTGYVSKSTSSHNLSVGKPTGINEVSVTSGLQLYPNPNTGQFKISLNGISNGAAKIEVINVLGETINTLNVQVNSNKLNQDINLQNIPSGIYFVKIATTNKVYTARTVISNK